MEEQVEPEEEKEKKRCEGRKKNTRRRRRRKKRRRRRRSGSDLDYRRREVGGSFLRHLPVTVPIAISGVTELNVASVVVMGVVAMMLVSPGTSMLTVVVVVVAMMLIAVRTVVNAGKVDPCRRSCIDNPI